MNPSSELSIFPVHKATPTCLSQWQVAQVSVGQTLAADAAAHLGTCDACSGRVAAETAAVQGLSYREVPRAVRAALTEAHGRSRRRWWGMVLAPVAVAALAVLLVRGPSAEDEAPVLKGAVTVVGTVQRGGAVVARDQALGSLVTQPGDRVRLHVLGRTRGYALVQAREEKGWETYFAGDIPADGLLPVGIDVTAGNKTSLRVLTCDAPPAAAVATAADTPAGCQRVDFAL
jgi:hypothetical protein